MTKKVYHSYEDMEAAFLTVVRDIQRDNWTPDYIVGLNRGGLLPGIWTSNWFNVPHYALDVRLRDGGDMGAESNCWMAEDAFGYNSNSIDMNHSNIIEILEEHAKNILIVDDINDTGATLQWIQDDWKSSCMPDHERWENVWGQNVRTAALIENAQSKFDVDYAGIDINKWEDPQWVVFPWEKFGD